MSTTEEQRHDLIEALRAAIGHEATGTLMGYLPPVGWADVATKRDLEHLETVLRLEIDRVETGLRAEIGQQRSEIIAGVNRDVGAMIRTFGFTLTGAYTAAVALAVTVSQLL